MALINGEIEKDDVLFYLNPFNRGKVFTRNEIDLYIRQMKLDADESYYLPCDNKTNIQRLIEDMIFAYIKMGYKGKVSELEKLLEATRG